MNERSPHVHIVMAAICWGYIGVFNRLMAEVGVGMNNRVFVRSFFTFVLLTVVFVLFSPVRERVFHVEPRHLPLFMASGFLSILSLSWAYFNCQMECSLAVAAILLYLAPSLVVLMSAILWKSPITKRKVAALALSLLGCGLVSGLADGKLSITPRGLLFGLLSAFLYAAYTLFSHYALQYYGPDTVFYWNFFFAGLGSLLYLEPSELPLLLSPSSIVAGAGLVLVATVLPYFLYTRSLMFVESGTASILTSLEPVAAALNGIVIFHEKPGFWVLPGSLCVIAGVILLAKVEDDPGSSIRGKA